MAGNQGNGHYHMRGRCSAQQQRARPSIPSLIAALSLRPPNVTALSDPNSLKQKNENIYLTFGLDQNRNSSYQNMFLYKAVVIALIPDALICSTNFLVGRPDCDRDCQV